MLFGVSGSQVRGNRVTGATFGLALYHSHGNAISGNVFSRNGDNLVLRDSRDNIVEFNDFIRRRRQALVESANMFRGNYFDDAPAGMTAYPLAPLGVDPAPAKAPQGASPAQVQAYTTGTATARATAVNTVIDREVVWENCERELGPGIMVVRGGKLTIRNCRITASSTWAEDRAAMVWAGEGGTIEIVNSTFTNDGFTAPYAIANQPGGKLIIRDSKIMNVGSSTNGIDLNGDGAVIENNEISGAWMGIRIDKTSGHRIAGNRIFRVLMQGIFGGSERDTLIENNVVSEFVYEGLGLHRVRNGRILNNRVYGGVIGLAMGEGGYVIRGNTFVDGVQAVNLWGGPNVIEGNSFIGHGRTSLYDREGGPVGSAAVARGNYWSDYRGTDANGDGVGDEPYEAAGDPAPLMSPPGTTPCVPVSGATEMWAPSGGGRLLVALTQPSGGVSASAAWVRATENGTTLAVEVEPNPESRVREAAVMAGGQPLRIYQSPVSCRYSVRPETVVIGPMNGPVVIEVSAPAGCAWTVAPEQWLSIDTGGRTVGVGNGTVRLMSARNSNPARVARVRIGDRYVEVVQAAGPNLTLPPGLVNAASFLPGRGLAPGTLVSLFGRRLTNGEIVAAEAPQAALGDVRLWVSNREAYLIYASPGQINFLLPGAAAPGEQELRYRLGMSYGAGVRFNVAPASPGIFSLDGSGRGQAVAINQDRSFNSAANPASRGSVVTFFATDPGPVEPAIEDGRHPAPGVFPRPVLPLRLMIGGRAVPPENILFAGLIYAGILQVNLRVPEDAATGDRVGLVLRIECDAGEPCDSQAELSLAIR